jgi:5-methylthioadenosine/S-adenosylhomocysteine deaminase
MKPRLTLMVAAWAVLISASLGGTESKPLALRGTLITPTGALHDGWIYIDGDKIKSVNRADVPIDSSLTVLNTNAIIAPGFVDLHNHPMYAVFPKWEKHPLFKNRYEWRYSSTDYKDRIGTPAGKMQKDDQTFCDMDKFGETEALMGGTTSIIGISGRGDPPSVPGCVIGLDRNLDWYSGFDPSARTGTERIVNMLDIDKIDDAKAHQIASDLNDNKLDLFVIHLGEGLPSDQLSVDEFGKLKDKGLLTNRTAIIHGTAFGKTQFDAMHAAGTYLIWSPTSNLNLYGTTTDVLTAMKAGVTVALSPDWEPTGSRNMLEEIHSASELSHSKMGDAITDRQLFEMATVIPAKMARIENKVGSLAPNLYADLFIISGDSSDPYKAIAHARAQDVQLVMIGGQVRYATPDLLKKIGGSGDFEDLPVCGSAREIDAASPIPGIPFGKDRLIDATSRLQADLHQSDPPRMVSCPTP